MGLRAAWFGSKEMITDLVRISLAVASAVLNSAPGLNYQVLTTTTNGGLGSFEHFLEANFPESRRKADYLMSIHDHLRQVPAEEIESLFGHRVPYTRDTEHRDKVEIPSRFSCNLCDTLLICSPRDKEDWIDSVPGSDSGYFF